jgi:hypothetical protein
VTERELPVLYGCHHCRRIGDRLTALVHEAATGHVSERVSDAMALATRATWAREGRSLIDGDDLPTAHELAHGGLDVAP